METKLVEFSDTILYVGIDVHKRQWSVTILTQAIHHRTFSQPSDPLALKHYIDQHFPGAKVKCATVIF